MSSSSKRGFGSLGFAGVVGAIVSFCTTPAFTGWAGAAKALLVGAGTSMGATIVAVPALLAGYFVAGIAGALTGSKRTAVKCGVLGALACGLPAAFYGAYHGYEFSRSALTEQSCVTSFNNAADKGGLKASAPAPVVAQPAVSAPSAPRSPG